MAHSQPPEGRGSSLCSAEWVRCFFWPGRHQQRTQPEPTPKSLNLSGDARLRLKKLQSRPRISDAPSNSQVGNAKSPIGYAKGKMIFFFFFFQKMVKGPDQTSSETKYRLSPQRCCWSSHAVIFHEEGGRNMRSSQRRM